MKLKAFSILEVLVAIVISGIVISSAYSVYVFSHKQFFKFSASKAEIRNYFELSNVLNREFEMANKVIKKSEREIEIQQIEKKINYFFDNEYILRTIGFNTDTFKIAVSDLEMNIMDEVKEEKLIAYIKITLDDVSENNTWSFYKDYGAILMLE